MAEETPRHELVDRLLHADSADAERLMRLRKEMTSMIEFRWPVWKRITAALGGVLLIFLGSGAGISVWMRGDREPAFVRTMSAISLTMSIALGTFMIWLAWRGVFHRRRHNEVFLLMAIATLGVLGLIFLNAGWSAGNDQLVFVGHVMFALLAFSILLHFIEQNQLATTQRLLELEYRLAQMSERLDGVQKPRNDPA